MKVYSVLIASVTLFVFYNLAVFQENFAETKNCSKNDVTASTSDAERYQVIYESSQCDVSSSKITDKQYYEAHHVGQDDFALQVSGKDHQYLNTGVSFIYEDALDEGSRREHVAFGSESESEHIVSTDDQERGLPSYTERSIEENLKGTIRQSEDSNFQAYRLE